MFFINIIKFYQPQVRCEDAITMFACELLSIYACLTFIYSCDDNFTVRNSLSNLIRCSPRLWLLVDVLLIPPELIDLAIEIKVSKTD